MRVIVVKERHTFDTRTKHMQLIFQFSKVFNFPENHGSSLLFVNLTTHIYHKALELLLQINAHTRDVLKTLSII